MLQHQQLLAAQKFQELAQAQRNLVQQQQNAAQVTAQQALPAGITPAYLQQALGQVQGLLPGASASVPAFGATAPVTRLAMCCFIRVVLVLIYFVPHFLLLSNSVMCFPSCQHRALTFA
ncbi:unnamed protein product [Haemonchus placei]|uniref:Uncharacterized protein n=1 Tax=Haemonchus placei TaxID=6290 RepID=A0A3P7TZX9_HAEPC|nr:unnamed protein product [Haemonchus placei]